MQNYVPACLISQDKFSEFLIYLGFFLTKCTIYPDTDKGLSNEIIRLYKYITISELLHAADRVRVQCLPVFGEGEISKGEA